jgi:hypothetical protein
MAYTLDFSLALGAGNTGLTLEAQIVDTAGANVGAAITTGFVEFGASGNYLWHTAAMPDSHRGGVIFRLSGGGAVKAFAAVNGQEVENPDTKTSTRSSHTAAQAGAAVWEEPRASHLTLGTFGIADQVVRDGQAQGGSSTTLTLDAGASAVNDFYTNDVIFLKVGTGAGQVNIISDYDGPTKVATMLAPWTVTPNNTSCFVILPLALIPGASNISVADIWNYVSRTLTQTAAQITAILSGSTITVHRGDTITINLTGLGSLVGRTKLWFTVKTLDGDSDTAAILQIEETSGLIRLNGAAGTALQGSLTVTDATLGNLTISLVPAASAQLVAQQTYRYDVQKLTGTVVNTLTQGAFTVQTDVTKATS